MWYRLLHDQEGQEVGEIIAHDDMKIIQDDRVVFEKRVFQDLALFKLQVKAAINISSNDDDDRFTIFLSPTTEHIPAKPSRTKTILVMSSSPSSREIPMTMTQTQISTSSVWKNFQVKSQH